MLKLLAFDAEHALASAATISMQRSGSFGFEVAVIFGEMYDE